MKKKARFTPQELERHIADRIIRMIETDGLNWIKGWIANDAARNYISGHEYSGRNVFMTSFWMLDHNCSDPRFLTANQVRARGGLIRKGEKGTPIFYFGKGSKDAAPEGGDTLSAATSKTYFRFAKLYYVWNVTQVEWPEPIPDPVTTATTFDVSGFEGVQDFCLNLGVPIDHQGGSAFYSPSRDKIVMPPQATFIDTGQATAHENYYSTLLHELVHATGHKDRLDRESLNKYRSMRPFEELVAELGSAMLCRELGVSAEPREDNAAYIQGWVKTFTDKPDTILKAAAAASKAVEWMWDERNGEHASTASPDTQAAG